jgi:AraC family ethanolamine operon transcriptional activator
MQSASAIACPARFRSEAFDDAVAMNARLTGEFSDWIPLRKGNFGGRLRELDLGTILLRRISHGPMLIHGFSRPGYVSLSACFSEGSVVNGIGFGGPQLAFVPPNSPIQVCFAGDEDRFGVFMRTDRLEQLVDGPAALLAARDGGQAQPLVYPSVHVLARRFAAMLDFAESCDAALDASVVAAIAEECESIVVGALSSRWSAGQRAMPIEALRKVRVADSFLRDNIERPVHLEEVALVLGVSRRTLQQCFTTIYGISAFGFLKRRRLMLVRRALKEANGGHALVKSVALSHGFWHLGRFAQDYRAMFGEKPSETLRR